MTLRNKKKSSLFKITSIWWFSKKIRTNIYINMKFINYVRERIISGFSLSLES